MSENNRSHLTRRSSSDWTGGTTSSIPMHESPTRPSAFRKYEVSGTMDRLRSTMVGGEQERQSQAKESNLGRGTLSDHTPHTRERTLPPEKGVNGTLLKALQQIPAIVLIGVFHLMIGIPFGVSYFPISWGNGDEPTTTTEEEADDFVGVFPLPGKEALGIRMFLFSTIVGQVVFTFFSGFKNPIGLQMVENVPFCHALSHIVLSQQGYGVEALATLFVLFGLASLVVGLVFWVLGVLKLGRVVYYFPTHVLVGCIGGIGVYIAKTGIEVTTDAAFSVSALTNHVDLIGVVVVFEVILRLLELFSKDKDGKAKLPLLSPIYFCLITPMFYGALWLFRVDFYHAMELGYFFPSLQDDDKGNSSTFVESLFNVHLLDMWRFIDLSVVSWKAISSSIPTLLALTLFSLIHVPINIPAFALSTNTEADMNVELVAHGYSNMIAGSVGGLQNYLAYTQSVLYDRSGGMGKISGVAVAVLTAVLFVIGPMIASYIPRCMAGTLLVHVGIDLFLEGVYDSFGKFDKLEYGGIWLITIVMTLYGMEAAMIAGVITAISTYVAQSMAYVNPVRGSMSAFTLRSSQLNRNHKAWKILDDPATGRSRILVIQLQGHLFFGNMVHLTENVNKLLSERQGTPDEPIVVIVDFSLVLGIDSSAAQAMARLKTAMRKRYHVQLSIFVSGSDDGFPCEFDLSKELSAPTIPTGGMHDGDPEAPNEGTLLLPLVSSFEAMQSLAFTGSHVCDTLNLALIFAENALIDREDPSLLDENTGVSGGALSHSSSLTEEREMALTYLENLCPGKVDKKHLQTLFAEFEREVFVQDEFLWKQGSPSNCTKLLVRGTLISLLENEAGTSETIASGNTIGESGLIEGVPRMSSVQCLSEEAVLYTLSEDAYNKLVKGSPHVARLVDLICIRYLTVRVQHVSNRIFETRCLPI